MFIDSNALKLVSDMDDAAVLAGVSLSSDGELVIPSLGRDYRITINAYVNGNNGRDNSTADMWLYMNGEEVAHRHDQRFSTYQFSVDHSFLHVAGSLARFRFEHTNHVADETAYGMFVKNIEPI